MFTKKNLLALVAGSALVFSALGPVSAQAAALTSAQVEAITNLLQSFGADASTIASVQAVLSGTASDTSTTSVPSELPGNSASSNGNSCAVLSANLHVGSEGEDVSRLQAFLSKDPTAYPEGRVTGYFGDATESAVERWQAEHGIVATGTPMTTGFGLVGPSTRHEMDQEMEMECGDSHQGAGDSATSTASSSQDSQSSDN